MFLSFLWHLHQPIYRDPDSREYVLPWVNFHVTKNYYQMARLAEEADFPCAFNLVPCLLEQMDDYGQGKARDILQKALEMNPEKLSAAQIARMAKFLPAGEQESDRTSLQLKAFEAFFSPLLEIKQNKDFLLELQKKIHSEIISFYRKLWKNGVIELTTSAYYHPLLPLIFNLGVGGEPVMPALPFMYPEDGEAQIKKGRTYFAKIFGAAPQGFWPSEGGISQAVARAAAQQGFAFAVTDENILWKCLKTAPTPKLLSKPYLSEGLSLFFRDRELSDLISFEYHRWGEKDAVRHFLAKIDERQKQSPEQAICVVALDGENPWAGYRENGVPFLRELYSQLKKKNGLRPVIFKNYLKQFPPQEEVNLVPGTWLGNFSKWVGHPAKNAAWDELSRARGACGLNEEMFIAEGSDWFWWFGEQNVSEFDALFHGYIQKACEREGK